MGELLKAKGICKSFSFPAPVSVLKNIDLTVSCGENVAIEGRSGEGKSTLLYILGTLEESCSGTIEIAQQKVTSHNRCSIRNQHMGFVFQFFNLLDDATALHNVLMPARIARQAVGPGSQAYQRAMELLDQVGMKHRAHFITRLLSGGEKQRIAIARALCNDPSIIFADEPSGNLDKDNAVKIHDLLLSCVREHNKALVVVTHDTNLAYLCNRRYRLESGSLLSM